MTHDPDIEIVACPDGPLLVRGDVRITNPDGEDLPRRRRTVALCRCGKSMLKPYCDGTHKIIGFRTEPELPATDVAADPV
ncbi:MULTISPECIES: CDGSH iron-sulfur domain-containing protein [unclassified Curtobacterium]|uniref:CDGSH iron-sulfur domain-containing protein n=1 Tax=unclassified Curtobacterium TaxID=257496 RepID=UPI000DA903A3|nr:MULTISPECIES: CDGSH iron-sulfur domain-containing protein [unclassified Curtobacterium]PZE25654.1 CDGSH iron-sulfur domain-containing protein [Curtobacterium sp. MCBD17_028]PZF57137.1 CDGSH iron-sulfur domain-containing protein [Curtobacterium sp. MCBD17_034]PZF63280.1 CDGSH iron-sulfur domain-containing protein [Curtobacterium sp. MCBD17_013]PZM33513.1 CDGSH iron-sulfur domain-containing protein [Curtobacterium sp. MCBD17_031]WIB64303.1 CDGSH iron-sulfur domain-containing protein [Curtobac